jgi:large subunit ribosomal protein L19
MKGKLIDSLENKYMKKNVPEFAVGDTVKVSVRIIDEAGKERVQAFTGTVIAKQGSGLSETFSVHRVAYGEGMERLFFLHSPLIADVEVTRRGSVRRSKLYFLRGTRGKAAKVKSRFMQMPKKSAHAQQEPVAEEATDSETKEIAI